MALQCRKNYQLIITEIHNQIGAQSLKFQIKQNAAIIIEKIQRRLNQDKMSVQKEASLVKEVIIKLFACWVILGAYLKWFDSQMNRNELNLNSLQLQIRKKCHSLTTSTTPPQQQNNQNCSWVETKNGNPHPVDMML